MFSRNHDIERPATRSGVADVAATRQDDRIISGGDPVNNSANIVWHFERVLRDDDDVSRGVGRSACAYTSTYVSPCVVMATLSCRRAHRVPSGTLVYPGTERLEQYDIPRRSSRHCSRVLFSRFIVAHDGGLDYWLTTDRIETAPNDGIEAEMSREANQ